jgi:acetamidase/formamidase
VRPASATNSPSRHKAISTTVYGPYAKPVLTIDPGDVVAVETEDAFGGVITSEQDSPTAKLKFPFLNPQCGPIAVNGIEKGDCLAVHIHAVETGARPPARPASFRNSAGWSARRRPRFSIRRVRSGCE